MGINNTKWEKDGSCISLLGPEGRKGRSKRWGFGGGGDPCNPHSRGQSWEEGRSFEPQAPTPLKQKQNHQPAPQHSHHYYSVHNKRIAIIMYNLKLRQNRGIRSSNSPNNNNLNHHHQTTKTSNNKAQNTKEKPQPKKKNTSPSNAMPARKRMPPLPARPLSSPMVCVRKPRCFNASFQPPLSAPKAPGYNIFFCAVRKKSPATACHVLIVSVCPSRLSFLVALVAVSYTHLTLPTILLV